MIFYDCTPAPSPRRARMFIAEKGIEVETRQVDLRSGEHLQDAYRAINPGATVPTLVTDEGVAITNNAGIAAFLEAFKPDPALCGKTPTEKGLVAAWNTSMEQNGFLSIAEAFRNSAPGFVGRALTGPVNYDQIPALAERGQKRVGVFFELLESRLQGREHLATDAFSLADITGFVCVAFADRLKMHVPEGATATKAWFERISARPSAQV